MSHAEALMTPNQGVNNPINTETSPDAPGDVIVVVQSPYVVSPWIGLPRFDATKPYAKPIGLESLSDDTWMQLSSEFGSVASSSLWLNSTLSIYPTLVLIPLCLYPLYLVDQATNQTMTRLCMIVGLLLAILTFILYVWWVRNSIRRGCTQIEALVQRFEALVEMEGYKIEYVKKKNARVAFLRTHEVRFRPLGFTTGASTTLTQQMPRHELGTKLQQAESVLTILFFCMMNHLLVCQLFET